MKLAGIREDDLVRVDDGLPYFAEVLVTKPRELTVRPITGPRGVRTVRAGRVVAHWRKAGCACREGRVS